MKEDVLNQQLRKFLKEVGVTSQRAIEHAVHEALASGRLTGRERLAATVTLELPQLGTRHVVEGTIALE
jgi:hypothetical protein